MAQDWLPGRRVNQLAMAKNWVNILEAGNQENWFVEEFDELKDFTKTADELFETAMHTDDRNVVLTARMNTAFHNMTACMRNIKNRKKRQKALFPVKNGGFIWHKIGFPAGG